MTGRDLSAHFNGVEYFVPDEGAPACPVCRLVDRFDWVNPSFRGPSRPLDLGFTYDGMLVASARFVDVCRGVAGVRFLGLPAAPGWFLVVVDPVVPVREHETLRRLRPCPRCGRFTEVAGPLPTLLAEPPPGFSLTEGVYGSASDHWDRVIAQGHRCIVDEPTSRLLEEADLSGLVIHDRPYEVEPGGRRDVSH